MTFAERGIRLLSHSFAECVPKNELEAEPTPVNAMVFDLTPLDIHDFDQIDLVSAGGLTRIFPGHNLSIREKYSCPVPAEQIVWTSPQTLVEEMLDLGAAAKNAFCLVIENCHDKRSFESGIIGVQIDELFGLAGFGKFVPLFVYPGAVGFGGLSHPLVLRSWIWPSDVSKT
jgi:hypothetical protein